MKTLLSFFLVWLPMLCCAQSAIKWQYSAKKITAKNYEVHLTASISDGWHTFSQMQPEDAIALPTKITFDKNPLVQVDGKMKEVGKMEKVVEQTIGIEQWQYSGKVDFVQAVTVRDSRSEPRQVRTAISGSITYQLCNDHECMPPKTERFTVKIGE